MITQFISVVLAYADLSAQICDAFFMSKLRTAVARYIRTYITYLKGGKNVAQYLDAFIQADEDVMNLLEEICYLKFAPSTPLLSMRCICMRLRLDVLRMRKSVVSSGYKVGECILGNKSEQNDKDTRSSCLSRVSGTKAKILDFIKRSPRIRVRDVMREFSVLSDRTVKRNIKELMDAGLVKKEIHERVVHYIPVA